jgi:Arc/MetJ-type ribon-helix-helix transcriptional regulator
MTLSYRGPIMGEGKTRISARVDDELIDWIDRQIEEKRFGNRSHALNYALLLLKREESTGATS